MQFMQLSKIMYEALQKFRKFRMGLNKMALKRTESYHTKDNKYLLDNVTIITINWRSQKDHNKISSVVSTDSQLYQDISNSFIGMRTIKSNEGAR